MVLKRYEIILHLSFSRVFSEHFIQSRREHFLEIWAGVQWSVTTESNNSDFGKSERHVFLKEEIAGTEL